MSSTVIGIDVSRDELVLAGADRPAIPNKAAAIARWLKTLPQTVLLVCEATGGYERLLVAHAHALQLPVHVANPRQVRDFARALGLLEKTDRLDAALLRRYGECVRPARTLCAGPEHRQLRELVDERLALLEELLRWQNRLAQAAKPDLARVRGYLAARQRELAAVEALIAARLAAQPDLQDRAQTLCLIPGVALTSAAVILAYLPELGRLNRRQAAKLAGLAPLLHDSGTLRGQAHIAHGRAPLRRALYCAALVAIQWHDGLKAFYRGLRARGKPFKVALIAAARKLLVILNSLLSDAPPLLS